MADRRRRRKLGGDEDSDVGSEGSEDDHNGIRKTVGGSDGGDSEYESADEEELLEDEEEEDEEEIILPSDDVTIDKDKPLDDDEDRKNPQYIPKKGTFYEHDDRMAATEEETKEIEPEPPVKKEPPKKKVWKEDDRWNHDRFNEYDQAPKSREELIAVYGYDIRNEEGPPRARRRRRYGRGPNKYTRNWEDLDAYAKPVRGGGSPGLRGRGPGNRSLAGSRKILESEEEFPALGSTQQHKDSTEDINPSKQQEQQQQQHWQQTKDVHSAGDVEHPSKVQPPHQSSPHPHPPPKHQHTPPTQPLMQQQYQAYKSMSPLDQRGEGYTPRGRGQRGRGRGGTRGYVKEHYRNSDDRGYNDVRQGGRGGRGGYQQRPQAPSQHQEQHTPREVEDVMIDVKNMTITSQNREEAYRGKNRGGGGGGQENRRNNMPPRLQQDSNAGGNRGGGRGGNGSPAGGDGSSSRPKRYSSQRQRSIPEQNVPPYPQQHGYMEPPVDPGYQGGTGGGGVSEGGIVTSSTSHTVVTVPHTQLPLAGTAPHNFVPPAFTTSPPTYPSEPFLGSPPAPRMFPPVTQAPHLFGPPVAPPVPVPGPPVAGPPPVAPLGAPPVGAPAVPGPPVTGPPFLPPENMINFAAHPGPLPGAAPPHPPQFPPFQGYTPGPVSQPGEIYSNGVTYYNTESQQQLPRANLPLQKRPKAAIPIVPPPERERLRREAGRERQEQQQQQHDEEHQQSGAEVTDALQDECEFYPAESEPVQDVQAGLVQDERELEQAPVQPTQNEETNQDQETNHPEEERNEIQQQQQEQQQEEIQQPEPQPDKQPEQDAELKTETKPSEVEPRIERSEEDVKASSTEGSKDKDGDLGTVGEEAGTGTLKEDLTPTQPNLTQPSDSSS